MITPQIFVCLSHRLTKQTSKPSLYDVTFSATSHLSESLPAVAILIITCFSFYSWSKCNFHTKTSQRIALRFLKVAICSRYSSKKFQDFFWLKVLDICRGTQKQSQPRNLGQSCTAFTFHKPIQAHCHVLLQHAENKNLGSPGLAAPLLHATVLWGPSPPPRSNMMELLVGESPWQYLICSCLKHLFPSAGDTGVLQTL